MKMPRAEYLFNERQKQLQKVASEKSQTKSFCPSFQKGLMMSPQTRLHKMQVMLLYLQRILLLKRMNLRNQISQMNGGMKRYILQVKIESYFFSKGRPFQVFWLLKYAWLTYHRGKHAKILPGLFTDQKARKFALYLQRVLIWFKQLEEGN